MSESFVYNIGLLRQLLKIGQDEQYEDPESYAHKLSMAQRVKTVLDALDQQSAPPAPPTPEQQAQDVSFQPDPEHPDAPAPKYDSSSLETLGQLVEWAVKNRITVGGQRIAYASNEKPPSDDWIFYKLEPGYKLEPIETREITRLGYYVNKNVLIQFIQGRLIALSKKPNQVEQFQLGMRIDDANKLLGTNIDKNYQEPEKEDTLLDQLPGTLDVKNWGASGNNPLYVKDVKNVDALRDWLSRVHIILKDRKGREFRSDDIQNFNICSILTILSERAQAKGQGSDNPAAKSYITHTSQLMQAANCAGGGGGGGDQGGGGGAGGRNAQLLQQLMSLRPFNSQYISFPEITKWLDTYSAYANDGDITDNADKLKGFMDNFKEKSNFGDTIQLNNMDAQQFKNELKQPSDAINMGSYLYDTIVQAGGLYQRMVVQLQNLGQDPRFADAYRQMQQQVTAGGPQQTNKSNLYDLVQELKRLWQQHK